MSSAAVTGITASQRELFAGCLLSFSSDDTVPVRQTETCADWLAWFRRTCMVKTATRVWDPAEHLQSEEDMAAYLEAALEEGDPALVAAALGDIARAKGMSQLAREAGLGRESLYKALSPTGNPEFATIMKVVAALGLRLHATPATK